MLEFRWEGKLRVRPQRYCFIPEDTRRHAYGRSFIDRVARLITRSTQTRGGGEFEHKLGASPHFTLHADPTFVRFNDFTRRW